MIAFRITLAKYADQLMASSRAARWNSNDVKLVYTSSSLSLACLENVVHRSHLGLNQQFRALKIEIPDSLKVEEINIATLEKNWTSFELIPITQKIGDDWIKSMRTCILKVPSSIIFQEHNYLMNPKHPDFKEIKIVYSDLFVFDHRIKS
ncbi:MAG: RES family NAD+ phosphorylase [Sphingobacteriales bacterium]|nr:RES family NAD+ phosphorylase [Sphingobacteriales bacterium]